jgi:hypothetical protein
MACSKYELYRALHNTTHRANAITGRIKCGLGSRKQGKPSFGERYLSRRTTKKLYSKLLFELLYPLTERTRRQVDSASSRTEVEEARRLDKAAE